MKLLVVQPESNDTQDCEQIDDLITKYLQEEFHIDASSPSLVADAIKQARKDHSIPQAKVALVIDGAALSLIFQDLKDCPNDTIRVLQDKFCCWENNVDQYFVAVSPLHKRPKL